MPPGARGRGSVFTGARRRADAARDIEGTVTLLSRRRNRLDSGEGGALARGVVALGLVALGLAAVAINFELDLVVERSVALLLSRGRPGDREHPPDEPPVHGVGALLHDQPHPLAGHPGERTDGVQVEAQVVFAPNAG